MIVDDQYLNLIQNIQSECWVDAETMLPPIGMVCFLELPSGIWIGAREEVEDGWIWGYADGAMV